ncbi:MAG: methyl-accepting chemotaxis protein [Rhizobacter sp.]
MKNLALKSKMLLAFAGCIALMLVLGAGSIWAAGKLSRHTTEVSAHWLPAVQAAKNMQLAFYEMHMQRMNFILASDDDQSTAIEKRFGEVAADLKKQRDLFGTFSDDTAGLAAFDALVVKYAEGHASVANLVKQGNNSAATVKLKDDLAPTFKALHAQLSAWVNASVAGSQAEAEAAATTGRNAERFMAGGLALTVLLATGVSLLITRNVMRQLGGDPSYAFRVVTEIVGGNLAFKVKTAPGDNSSLLYALKGMASSLAVMVTNVNDCAMNIRGATREVASGNLDFSNRTEHQSSKLQATASSMAKLDQTVRQAADSVRQADTLALGASSVASEGGEVVSAVVTTMKEINTSSKKIADITGVIDSIAFQTNILALNAAVEAARAGEQGRGFAVVASEVRSLAQRCAGAAKEIKTLISASVERVEQGTNLVDRAGAKMGDVVSAIQRVNDVMGHIKSSSDQQSAEVSRIGLAVVDMDQTTQQNAALVEQCAASAESLDSQVEKLLGAVSAFRLPEGGLALAA